MIPYARHEISPSDVSAVVSLLKESSLTQGSMVPLFENKISSRVGSKHAVAVSSATAALHLACIALDLKKGDYLWTSPNSFVASANCALYCGANVDFVDINPRTYNICVNALEEKLVIANKLGNLPKIIVPVHFAGQSCDVERIFELSRYFGFKVLEDASHAIGGLRGDYPIGSCKYSDAAVFSFHPAKIITTGEGGMVTTNCDVTAERIRMLRSHGITRNPHLFENSVAGDWYYEQLDLGFNYRLTDLQATLGNSQADSLDLILKRRQDIVNRYNIALSSLPIELPYLDGRNLSANHLYVITVKAESKVNRRQLFDHLRGLGIFVNVHYIPIPAQPFYRRLGFEVKDFPEALNYYENAISLPLFPSLLESEQAFVIDSIAKAFQ